MMTRYLVLLLVILTFDNLVFSLTTPRGSIIPSSDRTCVIVYHKPANVVTTHAETDVLGRKNVFQDIGMEQQLLLQDWHAVGRLDAETTGLLLLTNDGGLVHHITNKQAATAPVLPIQKTYEAVIMGYHENDCDMLRQFREEGVDIGAKYGGKTLPVQCAQVLGHPTHKSTLVSVTIIEGKNRQVRRMFHCSGSGVMKLKRTSIGTLLTLDSVPNQGDWRILSDEQVERALHWTPRKLEQSSRRGDYPPRRKPDAAATTRRPGKRRRS
jgi:pseudouridine synthase